MGQSSKNLFEPSCILLLLLTYFSRVCECFCNSKSSLYKVLLVCFFSPLHQFFYQSKTLISMEGEIIKIMNQDLVRLDRFDGYNFTMWQDKVRFLLTALKICYILDPALAPLPEPKEDDTAEVVVKRKKMEEDEFICRGYILNVLSDRLYALYTNTHSSREFWEVLENKYKVEEEGTKKFNISQYIDFKFFDEKPFLPRSGKTYYIDQSVKTD